MKRKKNGVVRFRRFVLVSIGFVLFGCAALWALVGCRNRPTVDRYGNVHIFGGLDVDGNITSEGTITGEDVTAEDDVTAGDDLQYVDEVVQVPPLPTPPPPVPPAPPPSPTALTVTLLPPFVGLSAEGNPNPPATCATFVVGTFNIEVKINIEGGVVPYIVHTRNYYGANEEADAEGDTSFFFDASVPTTECVSSQIRVTDANGEKKDVFFYVKIIPPIILR